MNSLLQIIKSFKRNNKQGHRKECNDLWYKGLISLTIITQYEQNADLEISCLLQSLKNFSKSS